MPTGFVFYVFGVGCATDTLGKIEPDEIVKWCELAESKHQVVTWEHTPELGGSGGDTLSTYAMLPQGYDLFMASPYHHILVVRDRDVLARKWDTVFHGCVSTADVGHAQARYMKEHAVELGARERFLNARLQYARARSMLLAKVNGFPEGSVEKYDELNFKLASKDGFVKTRVEFDAWRDDTIKQKPPFRPLGCAWVPCSDNKQLEVALDYQFFSRINVSFKMSEESKRAMKVFVTVRSHVSYSGCKNEAEGHLGFQCACHARAIVRHAEQLVKSIQTAEKVTTAASYNMAVAQATAAAVASPALNGNPLGLSDLMKSVTGTSSLSSSSSAAAPAPESERRQEPPITATKTVTLAAGTDVSEKVKPVQKMQKKRPASEIDTKAAAAVRKTTGNPTSPDGGDDEGESQPPGSPPYRPGPPAAAPTAAAIKRPSSSSGKFKHKPRPAAKTNEGSKPAQATETPLASSSSSSQNKKAKTAPS